MEKYLVGGAVRDILMGRKPKDKDYVVVNSSREEMLELGYEEVGKDFPVFLHPETREEYALARIERKNNSGINAHQDFSFETEYVTLIEDLKRRDLTVNSIALDEETGIFYDPCGGIKDLDNKVLRHTSEAFSEDPLRVLRVARFKSTYPDFTIAEETLALMTEVGKTQDFKSLSKERVFGEYQKALSGCYAQEFLNTLIDTDCFYHFSTAFLGCSSRYSRLSSSSINDVDCGICLLTNYKGYSIIARYSAFACALKDPEEFGVSITAPRKWIDMSVKMKKAFEIVEIKDSPISDAFDILKNKESFDIFIDIAEAHGFYNTQFFIDSYKVYLSVSSTDVDAEKFVGKEFGVELKRIRDERINNFHREQA